MSWQLILCIVLLIVLIASWAIIASILIIKKYKQKDHKIVYVDEETNRKIKKDIEQYYDEIRQDLIENFDSFKQNLVISALENVTYQNIEFKTYTTVSCENEEIKKKIVGKAARNKRLIENVTGVDLQILPLEPIKISSFNPFRREIAKRVIEKLVLANYIDKAKIDVVYARVQKEFEDELFEIGRSVIQDTLKFSNVSSTLYTYIGKLKFRFSYGQNMLMHAIECAQLAFHIAKGLNLNPELAAQCAFFHDIGKAVDLDMSQNHVELGVQLAKKHKLNKTIQLAIASHHNDLITDNIYCTLTKIVDRLSASRKGARNQSIDDFIVRANEFEKICKYNENVLDAYALKSCHELRIIIKPGLNNDMPLESIAADIKERIKASSKYNEGFKIKIYLTKEINYELEI